MLYRGCNVILIQFTDTGVRGASSWRFQNKKILNNVKRKNHSCVNKNVMHSIRARAVRTTKTLNCILNLMFEFLFLCLHATNSVSYHVTSTGYHRQHSYHHHHHSHHDRNYSKPKYILVVCRYASALNIMTNFELTTFSIHIYKLEYFIPTLNKKSEYFPVFLGN